MQNEIWQAEVGGQIYEATFAEMTQWIAERALLDTDRVRRGNLRWIEAGRVPALKKYFAGEPPIIAEATANAAAQSVSASETALETHSAQTVKAFTSVTENVGETDFPGDSHHFDESAPPAAVSADACYLHPEAEPSFVCKDCLNRFCKQCPKSFGSIRVCPICGDLCEPFQVVQAKTERTARARQSQSGFGLADFGIAVSYPFRFPLSLVLGALFYAVLLFGGLYGGLMANMILFGSIAQTIGQIAHGNMLRGFMPDFDDFSFWDDAVYPWFLGVGVFLVSWLPMIILVIALLYGMLNATPNQPPAAKTAFDAAAADTLQNENPAAAQKNIPGAGLSQDDLAALIDGKDAQKSEEAARKFDKMAKNSRTVQVKRTKSDQEITAEMLKPFLGAALPVFILFLLAFLWGLFYSPIALAIAGYTRSFASVINPMVGIDTMRRMGATYFKAFLMYLAIQTISAVVGAVVTTITAPFDLPFVGNLPAKFFNSIFLFYFSLVLACVLGLALFKSADKLGIEVE